MTAKPFRISIGYLVAICFIFGSTSVAWLFLGAVAEQRTYEQDAKLRSTVGRIWGQPHQHRPPQLRAGYSTSSYGTALEPLRTRARADLGLEHRRKGLLWYSTYTVAFDGTYAFAVPAEVAPAARLELPFPAASAAYDNFLVELDGQEVALELSSQRDVAVASLALKPGSTHRLRLRYRSRGLDSWSYAFGGATGRARDFELDVRTNFAAIDFSDDSLSPTSKERLQDGWRLTWRFENLISGSSIAVAMPQKLNPGPLAAQTARFAPVSLAFFFCILLLVSLIKQVRLHPVHYALLAASFFAFHLLYVYLVDLIPLGAAFGVAATSSVILVVSYLRLAVGARFALLWAGGAQLVYLVLFSLAFFLEGYSGLTITVLSVITLFVVMQLTGRLDWFSLFGRPTAPPPLTALPDPGSTTSTASAAPTPAGQFSRIG